MLTLRRRLGTAILAMLLLAGFLAMSQLASTASAQTTQSPTTTGDTLVSGYGHTCGLVTGGQVQCWGDNFYGQLGNSTTDHYSTSPVTVTDLASAATALTAGGNHTCAMLTGGQVQCWGHNGAGQLGNSTTDYHSTSPVTVTDLAPDATALTAGGNHTCAMLTDGQAQCWGNNELGQLGNGTTTSSPSPVTVTDLAPGATALTAGGNHTCAVTTDGQAQCWGYNAYGQLGNGTTTDSTIPVTVTGLAPGATALTAGRHHTCAVTTGGQVQCWGYNGWGQLGNGTTSYYSTSPVTVTGLAGPIVQPGRPLNPEATQTQLTLDRVEMTAGGTLTTTATITPAGAAGTVVFTVDGQEQRITVNPAGQATATFQLDAAGDHTVVATFEPTNPDRHTTSHDQADVTVDAAPAEPPIDSPAGGSLTSLIWLLGAFGS